MAEVVHIAPAVTEFLENNGYSLERVAELLTWGDQTGNIFSIMKSGCLGVTTKDTKWVSGVLPDVEEWLRLTVDKFPPSLLELSKRRG